MTSPSASPEIGPWRRARPLLGTYVEITLDAPGAPYPTQAFETAFAQIGRIHHLMSWHAPDSDVGRINRAPTGHWLNIDPCTAVVLHTARMLWQRSGGLFDITCERHLRTCGLLPADSSGWAVDRMGGMADLELDNGARVRLHRPLTVNLDGIAKGYAVDRAVAVLQAQGVTTGCVNAGGDLRLFGPAPQAVCLRDPRQPTRLWSMGEHREIALATTGSYFLGAAAEAPSAVIHPASGQAVTLPGSITVTAPRCMHADALTKVAALAHAGRLNLSPLFESLGATAHLFPPVSEETPHGFCTAHQ
ncbi:MAG: FAD:protein FMN transferase [Candidatus Macondimonas sp.]|jgi:thiamine biosynthesis lipoprotein